MQFFNWGRILPLSISQTMNDKLNEAAKAAAIAEGNTLKSNGTSVAPNTNQANTASANSSGSDNEQQKLVTIDKPYIPKGLTPRSPSQSNARGKSRGRSL